MSLLLGLVAALAWGIHDIIVRFVTQRASIPSSLLTVLFVGALCVLPIAVFMGDWSAMTLPAYGLSLASGLIFAIATLSLYYAFSIGPVKLVAPIIGAYPILSIATATLTGTIVPIDQWLAVLVIVAGVGYIAIADPDQETSGNTKQAVLWSLSAAVGFFATFAIGQAASRAGSELPSLLAIRVAAILCIVTIALVTKQSLRPSRPHLPLLAGMGALDALALGAVVMAGTLPNPEFAAVTSSIFGMLTVIFAWIFLKEPMSMRQWMAVVTVFGAILYLSASV